MRLIQGFCILVIVGPMLFCSSVFAGKPDEAPPTVDVNVVNTPDDPVPVTGVVDVTSAPTTHMGQGVENHVSLVTGSGGGTTCPAGELAAFRQSSDGNIPFVEFVVPEGMTFVVTDLAIGVREKAGNDWIAGNNIISFQLGIGPGASDHMWHSTMQIDELMAVSGEAWFTEHLVSGVPIGSEERVCIRAGFTFSADPDTVALINLSRLYGYLVDN